MYLQPVSFFLPDAEYEILKKYILKIKCYKSCNLSLTQCGVLGNTGPVVTQCSFIFYGVEMFRTLMLDFPILGSKYTNSRVYHMIYFHIWSCTRRPCLNIKTVYTDISIFFYYVPGFLRIHNNAPCPPPYDETPIWQNELQSLWFTLSYYE